MEFFKNIASKPSNILKLVILILGGLFVLALILTLTGTFIGKIKGGNSIRVMPYGGAPMYESDASFAYDEGAKSYGVTSGKSVPGLSVRNISPIIPPVGGVSGNQAEAFEVTDYSGTIETRNLEQTCGTIAALKVHSYVIFESENTYNKGCNFSFKVLHKNVPEIVAQIKGLNPKDFSENTYTIKRTIDDFTSEVEILEKKKISIDETLRKALIAYDEVTALATRTQNIESLTKIIDSRIQIIERLTLESLNINEQLDRLTRAKADQLDRLEYTYFHLNVYENKYFDSESIGESWKLAFKDFIRTANQILQGITVNLLVLLFFLVQVIIYAAIILIVGKYAWRTAKRIWNR